ncbi:MAG: beta-lactamase family protein [Gammaproteobacteria bacterium]|nr:beta-lactamase family protein [Gammaproteobacteria bacterium]
MNKYKNVNHLVESVSLLLVASCLLVSCGTKYQVKESIPYVNDIDAKALSMKMDSFIPALLAKEQIPGISINVIYDFNVVVSKSFGVRNVNEQAIVSDETVFEFASLSKPVFALAVLQLSEEGVIDLDSPLYKHLEFRKLANDERYKLITARMVLSHTTGLPNWAKGNSVNLAFAPGEQFQYSGMGYYYLQRVLERLTGKPLQQIVEEEVFLPLRMTSSSFVWKNQFSSNKSVGHSAKGKYRREIRGTKRAVSASSLISNARDYAKFLTYILEHYKRGNPVVESMVTPITQVKNDGDWGRLSWGLGWGIEETSEGKNIWHWGNNNEFRSLVVANLDKGIGLVYVANSASGLKPASYIIQNTIGGVHPLTRFRSVH